MYHKQILYCLILSLTITLVWFSTGEAVWYESEIVYQQSVTKIVRRGDIAWGSKPYNYYKFGSVVVSADGSKVLFTGKCEYCDKAEVRPFLVNTDGSNLKDISQMLPSDITSRWSGWRNMLISDDGSKVFFRAVVETGYYDDEYLYFYDTAASITQLAVSTDGGFSPFGSSWRFRINETGNMLYLDKFNAGWDESLKKNKKGLFYTDTGGTIQWYFDIDTLACQSYCGDLNMFSLLGVSPNNDRAFFQWDSDYKKTDGKSQHKGLYYTDFSGDAIQISDEHYHIYEGDWRGITNTEGSRVIYRFKHQSSEPQKLELIDVDSKSSKLLAWTKGLNGFDAHLSRSGKYVLINGEYGDEGTYYQTLIDIESEKSKDTWSYYMMSRWGNTSNITKNDRYYFYSIDDTDSNSGIYRIDTATTGDDQAPYVSLIEFSAPALLDSEDITVSIQVKITDPQGIQNIDWVTLVPLIEGQEDPSWSMGRVPIAFPSGDSGSTRLYDDGTHGDSSAGDGIYTFDSVSTRKGNRDGNTWNTWYQHYTLPADLGIRIIIKDKDNNYTIADTNLKITNDPKDVIEPTKDNGCANITNVLDISIPCAVYNNTLGNIALKLNLGYSEINDRGEFIWKLDQFSQIDEYTEANCSQISDSLRIFVPCAIFISKSNTINLWLQLGYIGQNVEGDLIWRLEEIGEVL